MTRFICNDAIVQPNNSSFIRQTPLIMLIVCVCPHSFNAKDIRGGHSVLGALLKAQKFYYHKYAPIWCANEL